MTFLQYDFMRNALLAGLLMSVACAVVGTLVVSRKMVFLSGGIAHVAFGGVGLGVFLGTDPIPIALAFAVASALFMGLGLERVRISEDSAIGILWAMGMAIGAFFVGLTPGYVPDLMGYLFGNILMVPPGELRAMAAMDLFLLAVTFGFWKELVAVSFDPEFAWVRGVRVRAFNTLFFAMVAISCVMLMRAVGIVLVLALITIPAVLSRHFSQGLIPMILTSGLMGLGFVWSGLLISYWLDIPSGATIVFVAGLTFLSLEALRRSREA